MRVLLHRSIAVLLVLAFATPAAAWCGSALGPAVGMAGMPCCTQQASPPAGSLQRDCCRINGRLPQSLPPAPLPTNAGLTLDSAPTAVTVATMTPTAPDTRARHDLQSARGRPLAPSFLRTAVLLI